MTDSNVRCTLQCESSERELRVNVRLENISSEPVLVSVACTYPLTHSAWLPDPARTPRGLAAARPFTFVSHAAMLLWFGRIPLPPGVEAHAPFLPLYARLTNGESRVVTVTLPLPLEELDPYYDPPSIALSMHETTRRIVAVCDYIPLASAAWINRGADGLVFCSGPSFIRLHSEVDLAHPIPILTRTDPFHRPALDARA
jgi:hypothetical protein